MRGEDGFFYGVYDEDGEGGVKISESGRLVSEGERDDGCG